MMHKTNAKLFCFIGNWFFIVGLMGLIAWVTNSEENPFEFVVLFIAISMLSAIYPFVYQRKHGDLFE